MSAEYLSPAELHHYQTLFPVGILFVSWLWHKLKDERSRRDNISTDKLEIDHILPKYRGGTDEPDNLQAITRPEHAIKHQLMAKTSKSKKEQQYEYRAAATIVARMSKEEYAEYCKQTRGRR